MPDEINALKDSGERRTFDTGAQRDRAKGKGRFELLTMWALEAIAKHFEAGALKYAARNWEKGMPLSCFVDSAIRHIAKALQGRTDEPHWVAAAWNLLCLVDGKIRIKLGIWPAELDDLPPNLSPEIQAKLEAEEKLAPLPVVGVETKINVGDHQYEVWVGGVRYLAKFRDGELLTGNAIRNLADVKDSHVLWWDRDGKTPHMQVHNSNCFLPRRDGSPLYFYTNHQ